ncbi:DUF177 domain-containing protein [Aureibaculum sp. 2210JD6-5]|uniref:YceD family protein n=1 Tax=Aureibaculum sp. 2210JD6-5 TaxID=3103957 RepID=UPI002AADA275|nr:DUF177 domain-containing protein [Aureibaculum sp. 2210JD6-5]MDY7396004.1 DUF177 domain-containing protein [Aureibaculum sp. 2210JD6-5]
MKKNMYVIPFKGLKESNHQFEFHIKKEFFDFYQYDDIYNADVSVQLDFNKKSTLIELEFKANEIVELVCDLTNELYQEPIKAKLSLVIKFGEVFNDDDIDVLILPHEAYEVDVSQYIYEMIVLAIPSKRIHPGIKDGTLKSEILDKLEELKPKEVINNKEGSDPRWDKLKGLITDKKV